MPSTDSDEVVLQELIAPSNRCLNDEVAAIGIGVPSVCGCGTRHCLRSAKHPFVERGAPEEQLEREFSVPVHVNNDANCFALGETHYGKGRDYRHIVGLTIGTGLGAGIINDRRLYNGSNCGAGEIGTIPYKDQTIELLLRGQFFHQGVWSRRRNRV